MSDYSYNIMNSSTRIGEIGARPHRVGGDTSPVNGKILMFKLTVNRILCNKCHTKFNNENFVCIFIEPG